MRRAMNVQEIEDACKTVFHQYAGHIMTPEIKSEMIDRLCELLPRVRVRVDDIKLNADNSVTYTLTYETSSSVTLNPPMLKPV